MMTSLKVQGWFRLGHLLTLLVAAWAAAGNTPAAAAETQAALDAVRAAAQAPLQAQRTHYPRYFERAYVRYPDLPRGILEAIAYSETGWIHVEPEPDVHGHDRHMPASYGLMGLYNGGGFSDQVGEAAILLGVPASLILRDPQTNILAAAALLDRASKVNQAIGAPVAQADTIETMSAVLAQYAGYGAGSGQIDAYARQSFAYSVLSALDRGVNEHGVVVPKRAVRMERAFDRDLLDLLQAPVLRMDAERDRIETESRSLEDPPRPDDAAIQAVDFGEAIWNPAHSNNYSTAHNSTSAVIIHTTEGSYAGTISWFKNPNQIVNGVRINVSAQYVIRKSDGQITQMVREQHQAYQAKFHNHYSIGIEHEGRSADPGTWTSAMVNASARLTKSICVRRGVNCASAWRGPGYDHFHLVPDSVRVKGHGMLTRNENRYDPGRYFPWSSYYDLINGCTVGGAIRVKYDQLGGAGGFLGRCTTSELTTPDGVGRYNHFEGGSIYWTPSLGAWSIKGAIRDRWAALGWERSILGYPRSDETGVPAGGGAYSVFQNGYIYWSPATGAHELRGAIEQKWRALGAEQGYGYPTTDESPAAGEGRYNHFDNGPIPGGGSIYWTPQTGAHEVHGAIRDKWASLNWEHGCLGFPTSDEHDFNGGRRNTFQRGVITWTPAGGAVASCQ